MAHADVIDSLEQDHSSDTGLLQSISAESINGRRTVIHGVGEDAVAADSLVDDR